MRTRKQSKWVCPSKLRLSSVKMRGVLLLLFVGCATAQLSGDLRLVRNGVTSSSYTSGRLEVYYSGQWGTVCDDLWDSSNTRVACRQLGLSTSTTGWTSGNSGGFGTGSGRIWLDNVNCFGTESRLTSCSRNSFGVENCLHSEDVTIYCGTTGPSPGSGVISIVGIAVGVTGGVITLFVIIFVVVCVIAVVASASSSSRRTTAIATTHAASAPTVTSVTTGSQQGGYQAYPAGKQDPPPPYMAQPTEMSTYPPAAYPTYPPQPQAAYPPQPQPAYPSQPQEAYPPPTQVGYPPEPETPYPNQP